MSTAPSWRRHPIPHLGLSVDVLVGRPVEAWQRSAEGGVFQVLDVEDGTLFVNWGEWASLEAFRQSLTDLTTRAVDVEESVVEVLGADGQRLRATLERGAVVAYSRSPDGPVTHAESPATRYRTEVVSFARAGVPVLVGYRVRQATVPAHEALLEHFLRSVRPLGG